MSFNPQKLYELLPALYRIRDTQTGIQMLTAEEKAKLMELTGVANYYPDAYINGPLKSLLTIIAEQVAVLEENLAQLYDDQFIETCAEWAVSYIGNLVGTRNLIPIPDSSFSQRGEVANTITYRRRKGTASVIEQLARDVTGWNANVVEYFQLLATTQYMNHLRPGNKSFTGLRGWQLSEYIQSPFDKTARTVDVRSIEKRRGKYNIQNIGVFLWRLNSYSLTKSPACKIDERRYTFNALGLNEPLFNLPVTEDEITQLAGPLNVPMPIGRMVLKNNLHTYYGLDKSILVFKNNQPVIPEEGDMLLSPPLALEDLICVCNLSDIYGVGGEVVGWANMPEDKIAIDPVLGRIAFPQNDLPDSVHVSYYYGFSAEMGGGEYSRSATFSTKPEMLVTVPGMAGSIQEALEMVEATGGVVEIQDNAYYFESPIVKIAAGKTIELRAADGCRPVLVLEDEMRVEGDENTIFNLNGFLVSGSRIRLTLTNTNGNPNRLQKLAIQHCTLVPVASNAIVEVAAQVVQPRVVVESPDTLVEMDKCITGALRTIDGARVKITNSMVDALDENEVAFAGLLDDDAGAAFTVVNSTIIGKVYTRLLELASNSIFMAARVPTPEWPVPLKAKRLQQGCTRFSYLTPGSRVPHPYKCQPASLAVADRVRPVFTSLQYGDPGYGQLSGHCAAAITAGADDDAEMGVFHNLYQSRKVSNLRIRLDEYLRFGLEAGIFYAS
jgi:hypothetical protein